MPQTQYQEQIVREAPAIEAYKVGLLESAKGLADKPVDLPAYQVAGFNADQTAAFDQARQGIGAYQPYMTGAQESMNQGVALTNQAANTLTGADTRDRFGAAQGYTDQAAQGTLNLANPIGQQQIQDYMNPYNNLVLQNQLQEMNRQAQIQNQLMNKQAVRAGAFGGSREGVQRAEMVRNLAQTQNQAIGQSMQQNYAQALAAAQQQQTAGLGAYNQLANIGQGIGTLATGEFNQGQQIATGQAQYGAQMGNLAVQQGSLGQTAQQLGQNDVNFLYNIGAQQQNQNQLELDAQRNTKLQQAYEPYQRLGFVSDIYKGAPTSQQSITAATAPTPSTTQQAVGLGIAGISTAAAAKKSGIF
jgi:hypothetical protein